MTAELSDLMSRLETLESRLERTESIVQNLVKAVEESRPIFFNYPEPIATPIAKENSAVLHYERFSSLLDAGEACIKYSAAVIVTLAARNGADLSSLNAEFEQKISLGKWAGIARDFIQYVNKDSQLAEDLVDSLLRANGKPTGPARFMFDELINLRNTERGHTSAQSEGVYESLYLRNQAPLHDALSAFGFLTYPLVRVEQVDVAGDKLLYDLRLLTGPAPLSRLERIEAEERVPKGMLCIWQRPVDLLPLGDLVINTICSCGLEHTFFLESHEGGVLKYHSYSGNHRIEIKSNREELFVGRE